DLHLADQLLAHVEAADEMGRDPDIVEMLEDVFRDPIVEDALAFDDLVLLRIEGGRVVLEVLDQRSRLGPFGEALRLAVVVALAVAARYARPHIWQIVNGYRHRGREIDAARDPFTRFATRARIMTKRGRAAAPETARQGMTTFDKREEGFEKQFAVDEELRF